MATRRHMHEYGTTIEQLAEIAVSTRYNARTTPTPTTATRSRSTTCRARAMIADPLTKLHCCIRSDGGGAIVLTTEERAQDLAKQPVCVLGTGEATSHTTMSEWDDFTESPAARCGPLAFERAGVTPADIDICQIYDAFTSMVLLSLEGLGFCKKGEGGPFVADGRLRLGGALPTNTDGGGLSPCHPGMRGMFLLVEAVRQLRGEAHGRQVANAKLVLRERDRRLVLVREHRHSRRGVTEPRRSRSALDQSTLPRPAELVEDRRRARSRRARRAARR